MEEDKRGKVREKKERNSSRTGIQPIGFNADKKLIKNFLLVQVWRRDHRPPVRHPGADDEGGDEEEWGRHCPRTDRLAHSTKGKSNHRFDWSLYYLQLTKCDEMGRFAKTILLFTWWFFSKAFLVLPPNLIFNYFSGRVRSSCNLHWSAQLFCLSPCTRRTTCILAASQQERRNCQISRKSLPVLPAYIDRLN